MLSAGPGQGSKVCHKNGAVVSLPPLCLHLGVLRETNLGIFAEGTCRCTASHLPLGATNEEQDANLSCIKQFLAPLPRIEGGTNTRVLITANLWHRCRTPVYKNRGVARYILSLIFSLVSLPFSFYFCVPNQKYQK